MGEELERFKEARRQKCYKCQFAEHYSIPSDFWGYMGQGDYTPAVRCTLDERPDFPCHFKSKEMLK